LRIEIDNPKKKDAGQIATEIEATHGIKLKATNENDIVEGFVDVCGDKAWVEFYEKDEAPNKEHKTTFKKTTKTKPDKHSMESLIK